MAVGNAKTTADGKSIFTGTGDTGAANEQDYIAGVNRRTQNAETVCDLSSGIGSVGGTAIAGGKVPVEHGGPFTLAHMTITPAATTARVPVPPCASVVQLVAEGGTVRYKVNGNATAALGAQIEDGTERYIYGARYITVYAAAGVKVHMTAWYEQSSFRRLIAFQDFALWRSCTIPLQRNTEIGDLAWTELAGAWTVTNSGAAEFEGVAPAGADATNAMVITAGVTSGWFFGIIQMGTGDIAGGFVFRATDVDNYNCVLLYPSDHSTKANKIEVINRATGTDNILVSAIDSNIALTANTAVLLAVYVSSGNYAHVFVNGVYQGVRDISTTHAGTKAGLRQTGTAFEMVNFGVCAE